MIIVSNRDLKPVKKYPIPTSLVNTFQVGAPNKLGADPQVWMEWLCLFSSGSMSKATFHLVIDSLAEAM